jgi:hypothetical protein
LTRSDSGDDGSSVSQLICPLREWFHARLDTHLSSSVKRNKSQLWTTNLHTPDCVRQQLTVNPLQFLEVLTMSCVGCVVDVCDLLDAGHVLQLQERFLAIEQVDTGVELNTLVGFQTRVGVCQRTVREAYDAGESVGCWVGEEGFEDGVPRDAGSAKDKGSEGHSSCGHLEL